MSLVFSGKVGLVTGGARGIGKATALKLAQAGSDIAVVYYNSSEEAQTLVMTARVLLGWVDPTEFQPAEAEETDDEEAEA